MEAEATAAAAAAAARSIYGCPSHSSSGEETTLADVNIPAG